MPWRQLQTGQTARLCTFEVRSRRTRMLLTVDDAVIEAPNWSPDGTSLIYNREGLLYRIAADGGSGPELVDTGAIRDANNDHVLSPDGRYVYVSSGDGHLYEISLSGGSVRRVSNEHDEPFRYYLHGISPDGATLAYTAVHGQGRADIFTIPTAGGPDRRLTDHDGPDDGPEFSPDGAWIYFNSELAATAPGHAQIFRMRPDGSGVEQLTFDERVNWFPHLSPDGAQLVYLSFPPGVTGHPADKEVILRRMAPDGGEFEDLVHLFGGQGTVNVGSWAPDSSAFAYVDYPR